MKQWPFCGRSHPGWENVPFNLHIVPCTRKAEVGKDFVLAWYFTDALLLNLKTGNFYSLHPSVVGTQRRCECMTGVVDTVWIFRVMLSIIDWVRQRKTHICVEAFLKPYWLKEFSFWWIFRKNFLNHIIEDNRYSTRKYCVLLTLKGNGEALLWQSWKYSDHC